MCVGNPAHRAISAQCACNSIKSRRRRRCSYKRRRRFLESTPAQCAWVEVFTNIDFQKLARLKAMDTPKPTRIFFAPVKPWTGTPVRVRVHPSEAPLTVEQIQVRRELMKLQLPQKQAVNSEEAQG